MRGQRKHFLPRVGSGIFKLELPPEQRREDSATPNRAEGREQKSLGNLWNCGRCGSFALYWFFLGKRVQRPRRAKLDEGLTLASTDMCIVKVAGGDMAS